MGRRFSRRSHLRVRKSARPLPGARRGASGFWSVSWSSRSRSVRCIAPVGSGLAFLRASCP